MACIEITIRAESPLSLGTVKAYGGTLIESGGYIAGSQLRGALGALKGYASKADEQELDQLLGQPERAGICFPNCYLTDGLPAFPLPLTAQSCKRSSGWIGQDNKKNRGTHGVADTLIMQLAYDRVARDGDRWRIPLPFQYKCPQCGDRTESKGGIIEYRGKGNYAAPEVSFHRQTRVAINRARLTAEEGQLYSVRAIDEGSQFIGLMEVDETRAFKARTWLEQITRIGGRTSRGFGRIKITAADPKPAPSDSLRQRLEDFNREYKNSEKSLIEIAHDPPAAETRTLFTINLRADALLRTELGLPTLRLDAAAVVAACRPLLTTDEYRALEEMALTWITEYTQPIHLSGWQTAWRLPKEVLLASRLGGLYVFAAETSGNPNRFSTLISILSKLQQAGVGEMREDGYGQIAICDPFHLEVNPV
ncbi:MAG: CRISPR-associated RAMP protein Csx10 [Blastocatellia bacterium]